MHLILFIFILYLDCTYRGRSMNSHQEGGPGRRGLGVQIRDFSPCINCSAKCCPNWRTKVLDNHGFEFRFPDSSNDNISICIAIAWFLNYNVFYEDFLPSGPMNVQFFIKSDLVRKWVRFLSKWVRKQNWSHLQVYWARLWYFCQNSSG